MAKETKKKNKGVKKEKEVEEIKDSELEYKCNKCGEELMTMWDSKNEVNQFGPATGVCINEKCALFGVLQVTSFLMGGYIGELVEEVEEVEKKEISKVG